MASWLDLWERRAREATGQPIETPRVPEPVRQAQSKPEIKQVYFQMRAPRGTGDCGEVGIGFYAVQDGIVSMYDEAGKSLGKHVALKDGDDPRAVAGRAAKEAWMKARDLGDFNRPLGYARGGYA